MKRKQTKTAFLFILTFICTSFISAQDYMITFSGSGQSTTIETVEVKNIDQQTTLTLNGNDTLLLTDVLGTGHLPSLQKGLNIYPNPAKHGSRLEFYISSTGNTSIEVYDFSGRLILRKSMQLITGSHAFKISGLNAGIYLVKVNTPENIYSRRLVSTSSQLLAPELQYVGINQSLKQESYFKNISNVVAMQYNEGERLVIKAISGNHAHTKSLVPTQSQNIDFEFINCIDDDGNQYDVVTIGEQVWMAENLKYLPLVVGPQTGSPTAPYFYVYGYYGTDVNEAKSTANFQNYGVLYNWPASLISCPSGWHLPSDAEWTQLIDYVIAQGFPNIDVSESAGNALKSCRQISSPYGGDCNTSEHPHWASHDTHNGFDAFSFSSVPGGFRGSNGYFYALGCDVSSWWSSTESNVGIAFSRYLYSNTGIFHRGNDFKQRGFSVRCLKD